VRLSKSLVLVLRPILGLYLTVCVLLVYGSALVLPLLSFGPSLVSPTIALEILLLLFGLGIIATARLEPIKSWAVLLSLGFISTIVSRVYVVSKDPPPNVCAILFYNYGFPFPWYRVASFYQPAGLLCMLPSFVPRTRADPMSFILNMIFYLGAYFAALETIRGIRSLSQTAFAGRRLLQS
jgi:hypothetical protein